MYNHQRKIYLGDDPYAPGDDSCLGLGSTHATKTRGDKHLPREVIKREVLATGVQHGELN